MNKFYILFLVCSLTLGAKAQTWTWGKQISNCADTVSESTILFVTAGANDVYVCLQQYVDKPSYFRYQLLHFTTSGALTWTYSFPVGVEIADLKADGAGSLIFSGRYYQSVQLGPWQFTALSAYRDVFIAKINAGGQWQWAKSIGSLSDDYNCYLSVNKANEIYLVTNLCDSLYNGIYKQIRDTARTENVVAKFSSSGNLIETFKESGMPGIHYWEDNIKLSEGPNGNIYWTGSISYYTGSSLFRIFNSSHQEIAEKSIGDYYYDMAVNSKGYFYIIQNTGSHYMGIPVLIKYDNNFNKIWCLSLGGDYDPYVLTRIAIDNNDRIFLSGKSGSYFGHTGMVGFGTDSVHYSGKDNLLIVEADTSGKFLRAMEHKINGSISEGIAIDNQGAFYTIPKYNYTDTSFTMGPDTFTFHNTRGYCMGSGLLKYQYNTTTGIVVSKGSKAHAIYPNPASEYFYIDRDDPETSIKLYNVFGETVNCNSSVDGERMKIPVGALPAGIYFLRIKDRDGEVVRQIVKY